MANMIETIPKTEEERVWEHADMKRRASIIELVKTLWDLYPQATFNELIGEIYNNSDAYAEEILAATEGDPGSIDVSSDEWMVKALRQALRRVPEPDCRA